MDTQLKKGVLEMCILHQLREHEAYGYEIMKVVKDIFPDVYDGSIYAILRRLNADGHTEIYMRESQSGPPRKYYRITQAGRDYLKEISAEWVLLVTGVQKLGIT